MKNKEDLYRLIKRIDGRGYKTYKDIKGVYDFGSYSFIVDHVQSDPFAPPSRVRVEIQQDVARFPKDCFHNRSREIALRHFLTLNFFQNARKYCKGKRGSGKSGAVVIDQPGQEIIERTSVLINDQCVEARFVVGLPAFGRTVAGKQCADIFFKEIPLVVSNALVFEKLDRRELYNFIETSEDADCLRNQLEALGLVAFVADNALLPRVSGIDSRPMTKRKVIPFVCPESFRIELMLPNRGSITGFGIPKGVTLITGGGYHGKSTLLHALELGVYNHIPRDGREFVVSNPYTVKIRAEDGRRIEKVDISSFIKNLPFDQDTKAFSSDDASGSTSQAANIIEALEIGAKVLLIDEDTSATNFMIRDHRMQELVAKDNEPITPFIDKVRQLYHDCGVSSILVIGGSGDYFDVAGHVICMIEYKPHDVTGRAHSIARKHKAERKPEGGAHFGQISERIPLAESFNASRGKKEVKISSKGLRSIIYGTHSIDLGAVEQLVSISQTRAIGDAIYLATQFMDGKQTLKHVVDHVMALIDEKGLDVLNSRRVGDHARFRQFELAAAINRLRSLSVVQKQI